MTNNLKNAIKNLEKANTCLLDAILYELDIAAKKAKLDKMTFFYTTTLWQGDETVKVPAIEKIEDIYLEYHPLGFEAIWTKEKGWTF